MADSKKYNGTSWQHSLRKLTTATDTITTLPVDIYADGNNATVGISGNTVQNGTPTPDNPIMPQGTGEMTGNLFDKSTLTQGSITNEGTVDSTITYRQTTGFLEIKPSQIYTISGKLKGETCNWIYATYDSNKSLITRVVLRGDNYTFTSENNAKYVRLCGYNLSITTLVSSSDYTECQLNEGAEALPYEPYGIKSPILSASTTTPVYLGEVESTRAIIKKVLDGTETAWTSATVQGRMSFNWKTETQNPTGANVLCTHYKSEYAVREGVCFITTNNVAFIDSNFQSLDDFKNFLADEYAAGHPVTIWYVQNTPTTGIVNELLMKIGNYADTVSGITVPTITGKDTFDIETTLKPSEASLSYTGWHDATVEEWDGSQWNE